MKLQPALIFGEGMVLQRDKEIKIWGTSINNDTVTVRLNDQCVSTVAEKGNWSITLNPEKACNKTSLEISSSRSGEKIVFNDVAIGEVWLAGGQSNMEFLMKYDIDYPETSKNEDDELLRCFTYPQTNFPGNMEINDFPEAGFWRKWIKEEDRRYFSAVAAYMGMVLRKKLDVPVGIISCNWGGTPVAAWTSREDLEKVEKLKPILDWHKQALDSTDWRKYITASEVKTPDPTPEQQAFNDKFMMGEFGKEFFENFDPSTMPVLDYAPYAPGPRSVVRPAGLYENMLNKVAPYAIRGFIWYQGEDDDARDWVDFYDVSMITMIKSWRKLWNEELPFYQIELAPFGGIGATAAKRYNDLRHKQEKAAAALPDVYDVCILDAGEEYNIHPRHKKIVGERLARIVMKHTYGDRSLVADCPRIIRAERKECIEISFDNTADGLIIKGDLNDDLKVSYDGKPLEFKAEVDKDKLIISTDMSKEKIKVEYCEANYCIASLYNTEGNPVYGFTCEV
ncbi:MAG: hypothetical protein J6S49_02680 [Erysipelotrichaceae bacterium]|nr:hypothetical protein [Erysipelotrichaceae bacterium]